MRLVVSQMGMLHSRRSKYSIRTMFQVGYLLSIRSKKSSYPGIELGRTCSWVDGQRDQDRLADWQSLAGIAVG